MDFKSPLIFLALIFLSFLLAVSLLRINYYLLDLLAAITPYLVLIGILSFILSVIWLNFNHQLFNLNLVNLSTLFLGIISLILFFKIVNFTGYSLFQFTKSLKAETINSSIKLGFLNKLYSNTNYQEINDVLTSLNLNIIGFSEFKTEDAQNIPYLNSYKYSLSKDSRDNATLALYSNYPLKLNTDISIDYVLPASTIIENKKYYLFVIHPNPPINNTWMGYRDDQLAKLADYINTLPTKKNIIIIGDFNTSVWSPAYKDFISKLPYLHNAAYKQGLKLTTNGLINAQIDHLIFSNNIKVNEFQTLKVKGSDHKLITAQVTP